MSLAKSALLGLTSLLLLLLSSANSLFPSSSIVELSERSWASSTSGSQRGTTLALFYAPWCPHCQRFAAHWKALARRFAASDRLHFAAANCVDTQLCARHGVQRWPVVRAWHLPPAAGRAVAGKDSH